MRPSLRVYGASVTTRVLSICALVLLAVPASADVALPPILGDHMVLQRETPVRIWGTADVGEDVAVEFARQEKKTTADGEGRWSVTLDPLAAGGPFELTVHGKKTITIRDVLVGEVWVGAGQSNMAGNIGHYAKVDPVLERLAAASPYARIRLTNRGPWREANDKNVRGFSALLFAFGVKLHEELDVPVGLMVGAAGGTPSGAWLSEAALAADPAIQELIEKYAATYPALLRKYEEVTLPAFEKAAKNAVAAGKPAPRTPLPPIRPGTVNNKPVGHLYEVYIRGMQPYTIRGVLWDQGESGTQVGGVDQYTLMGALIRGWRKEWGQGDFPFIYVQKPSGEGCAFDPTDPVTARAEAFAPLPAAPDQAGDGRNVEMHLRIREYPNTGMVISSDLGSGIHPENKSGYGSRAATVALGMVYEKPVEYYGPTYETHVVEGSNVRVSFAHVGRGLAQKHGDTLQGFALAGEDKQFRWADARIDGATVVLSSPEVTKPVAVRYALGTKRAWANLFNADGLPGMTFRTDAW